MIGFGLLFVIPSACLLAFLGVVEAVGQLVRRWDDRDRRRLVARYRNVTRVSCDAQACARRQARSDLQALRDFYEREQAKARDAAQERYLSWVRDLPEVPYRRDWAA